MSNNGIRGPNHSYTVDVDDKVQLAVFHWEARQTRAVCPDNSICIVLVHQYTKMGGCAALMRGMANCFAATGFPVVTFDMRGAGKSTGAATFTGQNEVRDVETVCQFVEETLRHSVILVGSSAGAPIAGSALTALPHVVAYIGIGYVFGRWASILFGGHYKAVIEADVPKFFIMGDSDGFTSMKQLESRVASCKGSTSVVIVPKVGHFELETDQYDSYITELITKWLIDNQASLFPRSSTSAAQVCI